MRTLGINAKEISIKNAVTLHFEDIGHDKNIHNGTYENSQARERTQILMDISNKTNGLDVGVGREHHIHDEGGVQRVGNAGDIAHAGQACGFGIGNGGVDNGDVFAFGSSDGVLGRLDNRDTM